MTYEEGKAYYFYDERANRDVCKAHVLHILPHPEDKNDHLIVYRWYGTHRQYWWYGVTTEKYQKLYREYVEKVMSSKKSYRKAQIKRYRKEARNDPADRRL